MQLRCGGRWAVCVGGGGGGGSGGGGGGGEGRPYLQVALNQPNDLDINMTTRHLMYIGWPTKSRMRAKLFDDKHTCIVTRPSSPRTLRTTAVRTSGLDGSSSAR